MNLWDRLRTVLLISTFGTTVFVFGKSVLAPAPKKIVTQQYTFPPEVPLAGWQQVETDRLLNPTPVTTIEETNSVDVRSPETRTVDQPVEAKIPTQLYEYTASNLTLVVEMEYIDHPHVNEKKFRQYDPRLSVTNSQEAIIKQQDNLGSYSLGKQDNRAYLRSCLNPRGPAAITYEQFIQNRYTYDWQFSRLLPVLSGQEPLRDNRCLWSSLSLPLDDISEQQAYSILEEVWSSWYQWWHPRFPEI